MNEKEKEYKALEDELSQDENTVPLKYVCESKAKQIEDDIEKEIELSETIQAMDDQYRFAGYNPDVIDFIRRCDTKEQAYEIIAYLSSKGEITSEEQEKLLKQLDSEGVRSFGSKKERGFYFHPDDDE